MNLFPMRMVERMSALQSELGKFLQKQAADAAVPPTMANYLLAYVPDAPTKIAPESKEHLQTFMRIMRELCEEMKLKQSAKNLQNFHPQTDRELAYAYNGFINELDEHLFLYISADRRHFWNSFDWIDQEIRDHFELASVELLESGTAFSCGLATASVFHSMRAAEYGLRSLARERKVKLPKGPIEWGTWEDLIAAVRGEAVALASKTPKGPKRDAVRSFYSGALGQFDAFRDEFRNDVMHVRANYDDSRALQVMNHVRGFLARLAKRTDESGKRIRWT